MWNNFTLLNILGSIALGIISNLISWSITEKTYPEVDRKISEVFNFTSFGLVFLFFSLIYCVESIWAISLLASILVVFVYFTVAIFLLITNEKVIWIKSESINYKIKQVLPFVLLALILYSGDKLLPHYVYLSKPVLDQNNVILQGRVNDNNLTVFVIIEPTNTPAIYSRMTSGPFNDKKWITSMPLGGGRGARFIIYAVAFNPYVLKIIGQNPSPELVKSIAVFKSNCRIFTKP